MLGGVRKNSALVAFGIQVTQGAEYEQYASSPYYALCGEYLMIS